MPKAKKRFGQHFLRDRRVLSKILALLAPIASDHLVEIGPGTGALTSYLLPHCRRLDVIEIDRDLVELLKQKFIGQGHLSIYCADALSFDFTQLAEGQDRLKLVGNLPYNISTPLLFHLFAHKQVIDTMLFMLQQEVVDRLAATPGSKRYGRLSVMAQYHCRIEKLATVGPTSFQPPPKVTSSLVRLIPHRVPLVDVGDYACFEKVVAQAFNQRRKTLRNALKYLLTEERLRSCGIDPNARAETLPLEAFGCLSRALAEGTIQPVAG